MNSRLLLAVGLVLGVSVAQAKNGNLQRGGLGFLFPDHNSFENPGQFGIARGMAVEALYARTNQEAMPQGVTPSIVYGNGKFGVGVFGSRVGSDLGSSDQTTDYVGAGLGIGLLKERLTLGASFRREMEATRSNDGLVKGTLTFNSAQRKGAAIGVSYETEMGGSNAKIGTFGIGYSFRNNASMEANLLFPDLNSFSNWVAAGFFNTTAGAFFMGAGYRYYKTASLHEAVARLGATLGSSIDLSVLASHVFTSGAAVTYGGSFRASF